MLLVSLGVGFVVFIFGVLLFSLFGIKQSLPSLTLGDFRKRVAKTKNATQALKLTNDFLTHFSIVKDSHKQEWLDVLKELTSLESIDTDKAADIREQLSLKNPDIKKEILDVVGIALKTKKDSR